jgi:hypothetical protein
MNIIRNKFGEKEYNEMKKKYPDIAAKIQADEEKKKLMAERLPGEIFADYEYKEIKEKELIKTLKEFSAKDIQGMDKKSRENEDVVNFMTSKHVRTTQLSEFAAGASAEIIEKINEAIDKIPKDDPEREHILDFSRQSMGIRLLGTVKFKKEYDQEKERLDEEKKNKELEIIKKRIEEEKITQQNDRRAQRMTKEVKAAHEIESKLLILKENSKPEDQKAIEEIIDKLNDAIQKNKETGDLIEKANKLLEKK